MPTANSIAILGTTGLPANYGGFETLAENLVRYHHSKCLHSKLVVYCSTKNYTVRANSYLHAELRYIGISANGASSVIYDVASLLSAVRQRADTILLLGVSGAVVLPLIRSISSARIITNVDGIEWKRQKWSGLARQFLRLSERIAARWSHVVIADNQAIAEYLQESYGIRSEVIAYGGDHALSAPPDYNPKYDLPDSFALALCRIEPENNVEMILEAFGNVPEEKLVFVGNWLNSEYGRGLRDKYGAAQNMQLLDPVYDPGNLRYIRDRANVYVHGHSAGGTNPSLVEMMQFEIPVVAFDCIFNRYTTDNAALYFSSAQELTAELKNLTPECAGKYGLRMAAIGRERYTWDNVGQAYFSLMVPDDY